MTTSTGLVRRSILAVFAVTAAGGAVTAALVAPSTPSATAAQDPCAASEIARTIGSVADSTADYLEDHPQTNQVLTTISKQQTGPQSMATLKAYFDANPQVAKEMQQLQQPLTSLSGKCSLPLTFPQLIGLLQAAQQPGGPAASLPGPRRSHRIRRVVACFRVRRWPVCPDRKRRGGETDDPAELRIRKCGRFVNGKARKSAEILLSFALAITAHGYGHTTSEEGACPCCSRPVLRDVR
jgi:hemophore